MTEVGGKVEVQPMMTEVGGKIGGSTSDGRGGRSGIQPVTTEVSRTIGGSTGDDLGLPVAPQSHKSTITLDEHRSVSQEA